MHDLSSVGLNHFLVAAINGLSKAGPGICLAHKTKQAISGVRV